MLKALQYICCLLPFSVCLIAYEGEWQRDTRGRGDEIEVISDVYYSQFGQDRFVYETFFKGKKDGFFIEFGASDGIYYSNSLFFEKTLGWKGLLIEPIPFFYNQLVKNRSAICIQGCVSDTPRTVTFLQVVTPGITDFMMWSGILEYMPQAHLDRVNKHVADVGGTTETYSVPCFRLNDILEAHEIRRIDYMSVDCECGELEIMQSIDFDRYDIDVIGIEANFQASEVKEFLVSKGYTFIIYKGDYIFKKQY